MEDCSAQSLVNVDANSPNTSTSLILYRPQPWFVPKSTETFQTKTFHPFRRLPAELRIQIWADFRTLDAPDPRVVDFHLQRGFASTCFATSARSPVILQINHESRMEGLRTFKLVAHVPNAEVGRGAGIVNPRLREENRIRYFPSAMARRTAVDLERDSVIVVTPFQPSRLSNPPDEATLFVQPVQPNLTAWRGVGIRNVIITVPHHPRRRDDVYFKELLSNLIPRPNSFRSITVVLYKWDFDENLSCASELSDDQIDAFKNEVLAYWDRCAALHPQGPHPRPATLLEFEVKTRKRFPSDQQDTIKLCVSKSWQEERQRIHYLCSRWLRRDIREWQNHQQDHLDSTIPIPLPWYPLNEESRPEDESDLLHEDLDPKV